MSNIADKQVCLTLNRLWQPLGFRSVRRAIEDITSLNPHTGEPPFMFLDLTFAQNEDGSYDTDQLLDARPVSVDVWLSLKVRSCDLAISCGRGELRAPTIIVATNYDKLTEHKPKFSPQAIWERDRGICQASGRKLAPHEGDLGHNIPKAKGGRRSFENIALLDKRLNREQGTRTFAEMGWNIKPKAPRATKVLITADQLKHPSQIHFLVKG